MPARVARKDLAPAVEIRPVDQPAGKQPGRFRRVLATLGATLGLSVVFVASAVTAVVVHLNLPPTRRLVQTLVNQGIATLFQGRIIAGDIDRLSLHGVDLRSAEVFDPRGASVVRASGVHASAEVLAIVRSALFGKGPLVIALPYVRVDDAAVLVERGLTATPTIADTFVLLGPPKPPTPDARPVQVALDRIEIGHAWAHGALAPPRFLDADINHVVGALHVGPKGVTLDVERSGLTDRAFLPAPTVGSGDYHLRLRPAPPGEPPPPMQMWTAFSGQIGEVEIQARVELDGPRLQGTVDIPRATPEGIASVIPGVPLRAALDASVDIDGELPTLAVHGRVGVIGAQSAGGEIALDGRLDISSPQRLELDADARGFDVGALYPITASPLDASGRLSLEIGAVAKLVAEARTSAFVVNETLIPSADVHVVLDRGQLVGTATLHEAGAPVEATIALSPQGGLAFEAFVDVPVIRAAPRLGGLFDGAAGVHVTGTLKAGALDARVNAAFTDLRAKSDLHIVRGGVEGRVRGPVARPEAIEVDATVWGRTVQTGGYAFDRLAARVSGPALTPHLDASLLTNPARDGQPDDDPAADGVHASGDLDPRSGQLTAVQVRLRRDGTEIGGEVARVHGGAGGVTIEGVRLEGKGVGKVQGGLVVRGKEIAGKIHGEGVDLEGVRKLVGLTQPVQGIADFDVDLTPTRGGRRGHIDLALENGEASLFSGVSAMISATFDDDHVKADGLVRLIAKPGAKDDPCAGSIAELHLGGGDGVLGGALLDPAAWTRITGHAELAAEDWDLRCLADRIPGVRLLLSDVRGRLTARATVERAPGERFPSVRDVFVRTHGLEIAGPQGLGADAPAWESRAIDAQLEGSFDAKAGKATAEATLFDGEVVLDASVTGALDLPALVDRPVQRGELLRASPFSAHLTVPRRPIGSLTSLPSFVREKIPALSGELSADIYADGTLDRPLVTVKASAWDLAASKSLGSAEATSLTVPIGVEAAATYDAEKGALDVHVTHDNKELASIHGDLALELRELFAGHAPTWSGSVFAKLIDAPIGEVPLLADHDITGHVSGTVVLAGIHDKPTIAVKLSAPDLELGAGYYLDHSTFQLDITPTLPAAGAPDAAGVGAFGERGAARASVALVDKQGGRLDATGFAGVRWADRTAPLLDAESPADLYAKASAFRLAALHPLVIDLLSKLDGRLDGDVRVGWGRLEERARGAITAKMAVTHGVFNVPQIGQEFHDASVTVTSKPDGTIAFAGIHAEGSRGLLTGDGSATLDGLVFKKAEAKLSIAKDHEIPVTLEGVPLGDARGEIAIQAEKDGNEIRASVKIPSLHLELPTASGRDVFSLTEDPSIRVSHPTGPITQPRAPDALTWALTVDLGRLDVAGNGIAVAVAGSRDAPPRVALADKAVVSGDLNLIPGGRIEVLGKRFVIDYGVVRLRAEDTGNPFLNVRAHWEGAPEGTSIYIEYVGDLRPITPEKLKFSSNAGLTESAIQAMLLGGGDLTAAADTGATGVQAVQQLAGGVAAQLASQQLNSALAGTALRGLSTQFGVNDDGTIRPGVAYSLGDQLRVGALMASAGPTTGTPAGATPFGCVSATKTASCAQFDIDWRFRPNWLIRGSVTVGGDQPSSGVDLLWQYRY